MLMPWGRVGSNLIFDILAQYRRIKLDNETLILKATAAEQANWLNTFYEIGSSKTTRPHIGSKQNLLSIRDWDSFSSLLTECGIRIVRFRRDNIIKTALSQIRAEQYAERTLLESGIGRWGVLTGHKPLEPTAVDPDILLSRTKIIESQQRRLMDSFYGQRVLDIEYEEIRCSLDMLMKRLRDFLELPSKPFMLKFDKATPDDLKTAIVNFGEVQEKLSDTAYAMYLG